MSPQENNKKGIIGRRELILGGGAGLGALGVGAPALAGAAAAGGLAIPSDLDEAESLMAGNCVLSASDVQGPFWLNLALLRQDITEGTVGMPLVFYIKLMDGINCAPIANAVVDVWHDDPDGKYSGFASEGTAGLTHLRGIQVSDANGIVKFVSVFPGWYTGRTPHLHLKINPNAGSELTTQLYFPDVIHERVYEFPPYDVHGQSPVNNETDNFFNPSLLMTMRQPPAGPPKLVAGKRITII
ncbi:MAG: protocatechuate 3,4-dioxygenase beta subunit [Planctomycetota bacterium]|jgi:protocatechuate 3,4-dioxygenase beta subunit